MDNPPSPANRARNTANDKTANGTTVNGTTANGTTVNEATVNEMTRRLDFAKSAPKVFRALIGFDAAAREGLDPELV